MVIQVFLPKRCNINKINLRLVNFVHGNPYRWGFFHPTKFKKGDATCFVHFVHVGCTGVLDMFLKLKIRQIRRILVNIGKFNRISKFLKINTGTET